MVCVRQFRNHGLASQKKGSGGVWNGKGVSTSVYPNRVTQSNGGVNRVTQLNDGK
jgi:hypothetical protein